MMKLTLFLGSLLVVLAAARSPADAHYCSNIWVAPSRLVIQPEQTTLHVTSGSNVTLKIYLQNNFPHKLFAVKMGGSASGYTISVAPPGGQAVGPGQKVLYTYTIKASTTGDIAVNTLNLTVNFRVGTYGLNDGQVDQSPSQGELVQGATTAFGATPGEQSESLFAATLADKFPSATLGSGQPFFGRTGFQQLIKWFGYRFCYNAGGSWRCSDQDCPNPCAEGSVWTATDQFPQNCMRAGIELAIRKAKLGSNLDAARNGAINAMKSGSDEHRCLAAIVGAVLWQGASSTANFENALGSISALCKAAGLRALGKGSSSSCGSGAFYEKAACAAAEGLQGNDGPVTNVLLPNAGDGQSSEGTDWTMSHFYAYMLYIVTWDRYGRGQQPSWYPQVGPRPEAGPQPNKDSGGGPAVEPRYNEAGQLIPGLETSYGGDGNRGGGKRPTEGCSISPGPASSCGSAQPLLLLFMVALLVRRRRHHSL